MKNKNSKSKIQMINIKVKGEKQKYNETNNSVARLKILHMDCVDYVIVVSKK